VKYHRGITHSFVALPFFAMFLAWLTKWIAQRRGMESPSWAMLTLIYGVGLASHILLDGMTSFGTRMWTPISDRRVAWDLLFIIDFSFTSIVLLPQVIAWIYRTPQAESGNRALKMWILFSSGAVLVWGAALAAGYPFHLWIVALLLAILAGLFFLPGRSGWLAGATRETWCRVGVYAMVLYLIACGAAHHTAMSYAKRFTQENHLSVERIAALPVPPCFLDWGDAIRTPNGVYQSQFDLRHLDGISFQFVPDSPPDEFTARALQLPDVQSYWNFARFPSIHSSSEDDRHIVDFGEHRFTNGGRRTPQPFSYRVVFDSDGEVIAAGFWPNGMFMQRLIQLHARPPDGRLPSPKKKAP
jgi:hypothetical protein